MFGLSVEANSSSTFVYKFKLNNLDLLIFGLLFICFENCLNNFLTVVVLIT